MTWILGIIKIVVLLGTLITIHELGHFLVARLCKVKVLKFAIGFGPKIFTKTTSKTEYTLRLIPFGGFVQMEGEEERSEDEDAFNKKPIWQRILIVAAGATVNIVFALIIYFVIVSSTNLYQSSILTNVEPDSFAYSIGLRSGDEIVRVNNKKTITGTKVDEIIEKAKDDKMTFKVKRYGQIKEIVAEIPYSTRGIIGVGFSKNIETLPESGQSGENGGLVAMVYQGTAASESGLKEGDILISINNEKMHSVDEIIETIRNLPEQSITLTVLRDNKEETINITPKATRERYTDFSYTYISPGFWKGIRYALNETNWYFGANMEAYAKLFTGKTENIEVMGVVGIANEITKTSAWVEFFYMMCAISLSLGVFNLLPIPALDGGRILILIIEAIRRKPLKENMEQAIILAGFAVIIIFAIVVTVFDVAKLF